MGGIWEPMVKLTKQSLLTITKNRLMNEESLRTLLLEVEFVLSSRPLTSLNDDIDDLLPLTLYHILIGRASSQCLQFDANEEKSNSKKRSVQALTNMFCQRVSSNFTTPKKVVSREQKS